MRRIKTMFGASLPATGLGKAGLVALAMGALVLTGFPGNVFAESASDAAPDFEPAPYPEGVVYTDPPAKSEADLAAIAARLAALEAQLPGLDYERARYHQIHFPPEIAQASNQECLTCHQEIMDYKPREVSPAGVLASESLAWYQTLDTYRGDQESFHFRHLQSEFAQEVMQLDCVFCHKGNDPRQESPDMVPNRPRSTATATPEFTLRKMVNPSTTCLLCHGAMPDTETIMGFEGPWHEVRGDFEYEDSPNGCLSCHGDLFRTVRHNVSYLKAASIEAAARDGSDDTCYGCHGGRSWYRISYPYPRHAWPDMDEETPEWAVGRATESDPAYALPRAATE